MTPTPFARNRFLQVVAAAYAAWWGLLAIDPVYRDDWLLENLLVFAAVPLLVVTYRRAPLSNVSYLLIALFLALHAVGAHYTYSEVPLGHWAREAFGLSRNHFDRLVHFAFGLLLAYPLRELLLRAAAPKGALRYWLPIGVTLALSATYEVVEWGVASLVDPAAGTAYLGTQGDVWDAQKDMALAGLGALVAMAATAARGASRGS